MPFLALPVFNCTRSMPLAFVNLTWHIIISNNRLLFYSFHHLSAVVFLVLSAWAAFQFEWGWGMHIAPTAAFAAVALVVMLVAFVYMERMKKQHDLVTYREVLAFSRGEQVDRDTLEGRREREMNPWVKGTRNAVQIIISAIAGGLVGVGIGMLAKMLS